MKRNYRWDFSAADEGTAKVLSEALRLPPLVARLLVSRGMNTPEAASSFLYAGAESFHDPFAMKGMAEAVERIRRAVRSGERIRVYGDYDADGVTSTALMIRLLKRLNAVFDTYIPHRSREGYGLNIGAIDLAAEAGTELLITVDNGISAVEQIAYAREKGIDVIVTDHHEPPSVLPEGAVALVNPKRHDCPYPFKGLSGAGVAFKLAHALLGEPDLRLADLAAIGIIADLMPLEGENRAIVRLGLAEMTKRPVPGIKALAAVCGVEAARLTSGRVAFGLAPRLNAGGRLADANAAVRLLVAESDTEAESLAMELDQLNRERQELVDVTVNEAELMWQDRIDELGGQAPAVIVLAGEGWNPGIAGLVASKLVERHYRPAVVLAADPDTGMCKGSARSIDGFDLYAALTECAEWMEHYGGHQAAAGMTVRREHVAALAAKLSAIAAERLRPEDWIPKKKADLVCHADELTLAAAEQLSALEPFGNGNPTPRFVVRDTSVKDARSMGKEGKHLRLVFEQGGRKVEAVGFGMGEHAPLLKESADVDVLGELAVNEWNGSRKTQLMLQDWRVVPLSVIDRRQERDWLAAIHALASGPQRIIALCGSSRSANRLQAALADTVIALTYTDAARNELGAAFGQTAASSELAGPYQSATAGVRLALVGLPGAPESVDGLVRLVKSGTDIGDVHLFNDGVEGMEIAVRSDSFPDRGQFGEVYALFRAQSSWVDAPDGFLRQAADKTRWPLTVVRMMQDVFEELGFLKAARGTIQIVADPPRKALAESARYRKAKERAEAGQIGAMSPRQLQAWLRGLAGNKT